MKSCEVDPACTKCRLSKARTRVVPGAGPCNARILFIGEAPGRDEDLKGEPFVGRAGRLLDEALKDAGVARAQVRISNIVKCRPPGNRRPRKDEKKACVAAHLIREIEGMKPRVICALGQTAGEYLAGRKLKMSEAVGKELPHTVHSSSARLFVTYHPAACLYQRRNTESFKRGIRASLTAAGLGRR